MFQLIYHTAIVDELQIMQSMVQKVLDKKVVTVQTSGSTGIPKQITLPYSVLAASAKLTNSFFELNEETEALCCLSLETIAGKMMVVRALEGNYCLHLYPPSSSPLLNLNHACDFIAMVPTQVQNTVEKHPEKLKSISTILIGGAPLMAVLEEKLSDLNSTAWVSYGMTETASHVALRKAGRNSQMHYSALEGISFSQKGEQLVIHAPHLQQSELITNDIVELISPTQFVWKGRRDFVINSGGKKLHLEPLESKWSHLLSIPFFLHGEADNKWGEKLVLYVQSESLPIIDTTRLDTLFLPHEKPKKVVALSAFKYSLSGKLLRSETAENQLVNKLERIL